MTIFNYWLTIKTNYLSDNFQRQLNVCLYLVPPTFKCTISLRPKEGGIAIIIINLNANFYFDDTCLISIYIKQL